MPTLILVIDYFREIITICDGNLLQSNAGVWWLLYALLRGLGRALAGESAARGLIQHVFQPVWILRPLQAMPGFL